ncbi:MAG: hypothetical protein OEQ39_22510 [Gammaproteobacteria bacterium]|nr:hypothetical protein [Gammaproteobacteria bacterium]
MRTDLRERFTETHEPTPIQTACGAASGAEKPILSATNRIPRQAPHAGALGTPRSGAGAAGDNICGRRDEGTATGGELRKSWPEDVN